MSPFLFPPPNATTDVAAQHPDVVKKLAAIMKREHVPSPIFKIRALDGEGTGDGKGDIFDYCCHVLS